MIRVARAHLNVDAQSHAGMTGKNNEDRYAVASFVLDQRDRVPVLFAVLADGIGGHRAGEVAAELAVNHLMQAVARSDGRHIRQTIEDAVIEASDAIAAHAGANENLKGMGATCATAWIVGRGWTPWKTVGGRPSVVGGFGSAIASHGGELYVGAPRASNFSASSCRFSLAEMRFVCAFLLRS